MSSTNIIAQIVTSLTFYTMYMCNTCLFPRPVHARVVPSLLQDTCHFDKIKRLYIVQGHGESSSVCVFQYPISSPLTQTGTLYKYVFKHVSVWF